MRTRSILAIALAALLAIVMLGHQSQARGAEEDDRILDGARRLRELDGMLDRAVLEVRGGLVQSYDILPATLAEMDREQQAIERSSAAFGDPAVALHVVRARDALDDKAALVEDVVSQDAVIRNSLVYLPRAADNVLALRNTGEDDELAREVATLLASVLQCRNDSDAPDIEQIEHEIATLAATRERASPHARAAIDAVLPPRSPLCLAHAAPSRMPSRRSSRVRADLTTSSTSRWRRGARVRRARRTPFALRSWR